MNECGELME